MRVFFVCFKCNAYWNLINLDYSRVEVGTDARRRPMKLWSSTANEPQHSQCAKIGLPEGLKMPIINGKKLREQGDLLDTVKNHANKKMSFKIKEGIGKFYE